MATAFLPAAAALFLLLQVRAQPSASGPINLTGILDKNEQFTTFIRLLTTTQVATQINAHLKSSTEGLTVFAPTDNAFNNLKPGTINGLSTQQQVQLVLYHVLPKFYTLSNLLLVSNPVRTQATGQDGSVFCLNFTGQGNQVNVSSGIVETQIKNALRQDFPLAVYQVDKVLLPEELFGANVPSAVPKTPVKGLKNTTIVTAPQPSLSDGSKNTTIAAAPQPLSLPDGSKNSTVAAAPQPSSPDGLKNTTIVAAPQPSSPDGSKNNTTTVVASQPSLPVVSYGTRMSVGLGLVVGTLVFMGVVF